MYEIIFCCVNERKFARKMYLYLFVFFNFVFVFLFRLILSCILVNASVCFFRVFSALFITYFDAVVVDFSLVRYLTYTRCFQNIFIVVAFYDLKT